MAQRVAVTNTHKTVGDARPVAFISSCFRLPKVEDYPTYLNETPS